MRTRSLACALVVLILVGGLAFDYASRTTVWLVPGMIPLGIQPVRLISWFMRLVIAGLVAIQLLSALRSSQRRRLGATLALLFVGALVLWGCVTWVGLDASSAVDLAQELVVGCYVLVLLCLARWTIRYVAVPALREVVFVGCHALMVPLLCWHALYGRYVENPARVVWLAVAFLLVYEAVFGNGLAGDVRSWVCRAAFTVLVHLMVVCPRRTIGIVLALRYADLKGSYMVSDWWGLHAEVLSAQVSGAYRETITDGLTIVRLPTVPLAWLRASFDAHAQVAYVGLALLLLFVLWWLLIDLWAEGDEIGTLMVAGALVANAWGLLCAVNLFWSSQVGPLASANVFQAVPLLVAVGWSLMGHPEGIWIHELEEPGRLVCRLRTDVDRVRVRHEEACFDCIIDEKTDWPALDEGIRARIEGIENALLDKYTMLREGDDEMSDDVWASCGVEFAGWLDDAEGILGQLTRCCLTSFELYGTNGMEFSYTDDDLSCPNPYAVWSRDEVERFAVDVGRLSVGITDVRVTDEGDGAHALRFRLCEADDVLIMSHGIPVPCEGHHYLVLPKWGEFRSEVSVVRDGVATRLIERSFYMK